MSNTVDETFAPRIERVRKIVVANPTLSKMIGEGTIPVRRSGMTSLYSKSVVDTAEALKAAGIDACLAPREQVIAYACKVMKVDMNTVPQRKAAARRKGDDNPPIDARARRVNSVLHGSNAPMVEVTVTVSSPKGPEEVSVDAMEIAKKIAESGKDACSLRKEDIYAAASEYFGSEITSSKKTPIARRVKPSTRVPSHPVEVARHSPVKVTVVHDAPAKETEEFGNDPEAMLKESHVNRVTAILTRHPKLIEKFSGKKMSLIRRGGAVVEHPEEAYKIAQSLAASGVDIGAASKTDILDAACKFLGVSHDVLDAIPASTHGAPPEDLPYAISIYTLLISALQLAEQLDKKPGGTERKAELEAIAMKYRVLC